MGALKTGFHIGVCCKDRDTAVDFMNEMFNEPEHKSFILGGVKFIYDNGDLVEWIKSSENSIRGKRFDFIFCEILESNKENDSFINVVLRPMRRPINIKLDYTVREFNENRTNKFSLIR